MDRTMSSTTDNWKYRRRFLIAYTVFSLGLIGLVVWRQEDTETARTLIATVFPSLAGLISAYMFSATWEQKGVQNVSNNPQVVPR